MKFYSQNKTISLKTNQDKYKISIQAKLVLIGD